MGTSSTLMWVGGLVAAGGVGWYLYSKGYFDSVLSSLEDAFKIEPKEEEDEEKKPEKEEEEEEKEDDEEEEEEDKKKSKLAIAYAGQQGAFRAYKIYRY